MNTIRGKRRSLRCAAVAVATTMLLVASPVLAQAAPSTLAQYLVRLVINTDGSREMLVAGGFDSQTRLPAQIRLSIPKDATIDWVGEILGGPAAQDPKDQYTVQPGKNFDIVVFTLTKARRGQVEAKYPAGLTKNGSTSISGFDFIPAMPAASAEIGVEIPPGAKVGKVTAGATPQSAGQGVSFYTRSFSNVTTGQKLSLSVRYTGGAAPTGAQASPQAGAQPPAGSAGAVAGGAANGQASGSLGTLPIAIVILGVIIAGTFVMLGRAGRPAGPEKAAPPPAPSRKPAGKRKPASKSTGKSAKA